ncbi:MAG: DUF2207 domain-containing protein, partial [Candidatus Omnitrophota bacterium]
SDVEVRRDSVVVVTETIRVKAEGKDIRRGIYRDFPTLYEGEWGGSRTGFNVVGVRRDGISEAFRCEALANGWRVYIGRADVSLPSGEYTYELRYETNRQINFTNPDFDQFYWNVTGNGWNFIIDQASVTVHLPGEALAAIRRLDGFTGPQGAQGQAYQCGRDKENNLDCQTTARLFPGDGFSILTQWSKGIIHAPSWWQGLIWFFQDHVLAGLQLGSILLVLGYFLWAWLRVGIDPRKGTIVTLYEPPRGVSAAMVRYLLKMGYDDKIATVVLVSLASKGSLSIANTTGETVIEKIDQDNSQLAPEEKAVMEQLFSSSGSMALTVKNNVRLIRTWSSVQDLLGKNAEQVYLLANGKYFAGGVVLSILMFIALFLMAPVIVSGKSKAGANIGLAFLLGGFALVVMNVVFYRLLKAMTLSGRKLMDQIEGFRIFLETVDGDRIRTLYKPEQWPEVYERYLPYAIALDVEEAWSGRLTELINSVSVPVSGERPRSYSPRWYHGHSGQPFDRNFTSSLQGRIAAASVAPSSSGSHSSSSSGGQSGGSGGGGGGGGGGGW